MSSSGGRTPGVLRRKEIWLLPHLDQLPLEVLVLMLINLHRDQVSTPLQVLHGVLGHYAKFPFDDF